MALQGTIESFALPDVLRLLAGSKKTGRLRVSGERGTASIWTDAGAISGSELIAPGSHSSDTHADVLFQVLRFETGSFIFENEATAPSPSATNTPTDLVLADAEGKLAEWKMITEVVPDIDCWVTLVPELSDGSVKIEKAVWRQIVIVGSGSSIREMGAKLERDELSIMRAVKELVERGLVDVNDTPAPPAASPEPDVAMTEDFTPEPFGAADEFSAAPPPPPADEFNTDDLFEAPPVDYAAEEEIPEPVPASASDFLAAPAPASASDFLADPAPSADFFSEGGDDIIAEPAVAAPQADFLSDPVGAAPQADFLSDPAGAAPQADFLSDPSGLPADDGNGDASEMARQLANLNPAAAKAVAQAVRATTVEERDAALAIAEAEDSSVNRGLLLRFLGSNNS